MFTLEPIKGDSAAATLDLAQLLSSSAITDSYFTDHTNIASAVVSLKSTEGDQIVSVIFNLPTDYNGSSVLNSAVFIDATAHDSFVFDQILLIDKTGSPFSINTAELQAALPLVMSDFSVTLVEGSGTGGPGSGYAAPTVTPGTYTKVTVDSKGKVLSGSNPTTLAEFGITDALSNASVEAEASARSAADTSLAAAVAAETSRAQAAEASLASAISSSGSSSLSVAYDAVVGSAAQVSAGTATHSSIQSAINAITADQTIFVLSGLYTENITVNKSCNIIGKGNSSNINGNVTFTSGTTYCCLNKLRISGNLVFNSGANYNSASEIWFAATSTLTDNGNSNNVTGIQD